MRKLFCDHCNREIINGDLAGEAPTFNVEYQGGTIELIVKPSLLGKRTIDLHRNCLINILDLIDKEKEFTND